MSVKFTSNATNFNVYNALGGKIKTGNLMNGFHQIDMTNYADGLYLIELRDAKNQQVYASKFIK
ncbi:MAG: T9SS type A sorting domain-containing protein [Bacteroidetes bacterium]|nr:T9SS type A sorting domain-containing protein [Bacteroidota bacterium]